MVGQFERTYNIGEDIINGNYEEAAEGYGSHLTEAGISLIGMKVHAKVNRVATSAPPAPPAAKPSSSALSSLKPTHYITKSENAMKKFVRGVKSDGGVQESIKYVEHNGANYIVDGHHRFFAAQKLGIGQVPVQQVQLPFAGYRTPADLILSGKQPGWWQYFKP